MLVNGNDGPSRSAKSTSTGQKQPFLINGTIVIMKLILVLGQHLFFSSVRLLILKPLLRISKVPVLVPRLWFLLLDTRVSVQVYRGLFALSITLRLAKMLR